MVHVISARCVARDLHTITPGPLERTCWGRFTAQWGDCKKSGIAPFSAIIIIVVVIIIIIIIIANVWVTGMSRPVKRSTPKAEIKPQSTALETDAVNTRTTRRYDTTDFTPCSSFISNNVYHDCSCQWSSGYVCIAACKPTQLWGYTSELGSVSG